MGRSYETDAMVKMGASVHCFVGGHAGTLTVRGDRGRTKSFQSAHAESNNEALRRVLVAALCWLDGAEQLVTPALHGEIRIEPVHDFALGEHGGDSWEPS